MGTLPINWRVRYPFGGSTPSPWEFLAFLLTWCSLFCLLLSAFLNCVLNEVKNDSIYSEFGLGLHTPSQHDEIASCYDASQGYRATMRSIVARWDLICFQNFADLHQINLLASLDDASHQGAMWSAWSIHFSSFLYLFSSFFLQLVSILCPFSFLVLFTWFWSCNLLKLL
jgi:hypothetical protein